MRGGHVALGRPLWGHLDVVVMSTQGLSGWKTDSPSSAPVTDGSAETGRALGALPALPQCLQQPEPQEGTRHVQHSGKPEVG